MGGERAAKSPSPSDPPKFCGGLGIAFGGDKNFDLFLSNNRPASTVSFTHPQPNMTAAASTGIENLQRRYIFFSIQIVPRWFRTRTKSRTVGDATKEGQKAAANGTSKEQNGDADHDDSDDDEEVDGVADAAAGDGQKKKKKKKKSKKKKKGGAGAAGAQTSPPSVQIDKLFSNGVFPEGEIVDYRDENLYRTTNEEKRYLDRMNNDFLEEYRKGAEVHRQVRQWAQKSIKPGQTLTEIAEGIENSVRALTGHDGLTEGDAIVAGMGFPTGLSLNHCAAHYTPNAGNKMVLQKEDVMKVDFGVHFNGRIVDSAFTVAFEPQYDNLLEAAKAATNAGVKEAGIDVRMSDIGAAIQEVMESYECTINGQTFPVKCIRNLNGHNINQYQIHGGKSVPIVKGADQTKMEEGETFAIETFGSTGKGYVRDDVRFDTGPAPRKLANSDRWKLPIMQRSLTLQRSHSECRQLRHCSTRSRRISVLYRSVAGIWIDLATTNIY